MTERAGPICSLHKGVIQGSDWPPGSVLLHTDRLNRNMGGIKSNGPAFEDVTQAAGIYEHLFGQGSRQEFLAEDQHTLRKTNHEKNARVGEQSVVEQSVAALITDLHHRGLLDATIVIG